MTLHTVVDIDNTSHMVEQAGLLYIHGLHLPPSLFEDAAKIPDFGRHDLKRPAEIINRLHRLGYQTELRFDAAHGQRYALCAYGYHTQPFTPAMAAERRVTLAAHDGIGNLCQHHLDAGCTEDELDAMGRRV